MKKIIALVLSLLCLFSVACSRIEPIEDETDTETLAPAETSEKEGKHNTDGVFSVGFGRANITFRTGLPLAGFYTTSDRMSTKILDNLYIDFVLFQDKDGARALLASADNLGFDTETAQGLVKVFAKNTDTPPENVIVTCTHTHSAPDTASNAADSGVYMTELVKKSIEACKKAVADLDKAEIYIGSDKVEGLTFVRRYLLADGSYTGPGTPSSTPVAHESEVDNSLQVIKFARENQKDIIIANWAAHATITSGVNKTDVSSDYVASFRTQSEKKLDAHVLFCEGAAGNQNPSGLLEGEAKNSDHREYGKKLSEALAGILENGMKKVDDGQIVSEVKTVTATVQKDSSDMVLKACGISGMLAAANRDAADTAAKANGFSSAYHASAVYTRNTSMGKTQDINITTFAVGPLAFCGAPYEMFGTSGMQIKNASPFDMTFICYQANGKNGYFPTEDVYSHHGYEVDTAKFVAGTAELFVNEFISSLNNLHK